ncbi:MAG TPA: ParB N-terminal domain-containing protein [Terriglobales bacterium]|jgi:ParB family chromosome partitioning protein|nr:ParB N-terminal domain-containing protein [Terriglobales bacterium]
MAEKKIKKKSGAARKRRKLAGKSIGLASNELSATAPPAAVEELQAVIDKDGGKVLASYREPFGGHWVVLAALPIDRVEPTPYQRNLSDTHVRKLEGVIAKLGRFLDPIIVVRKENPDSATRYWTPNGNHRLSAMKTLSAKTIVGLVVPEAAAAYQILALNTEKAHNLRERALEVIKMYQELATLDEATEETYALEFEEAALITLGLCYLENGRFSGGAYHPILRRSDQFLKNPLKSALEIRRERAQAVIDLDKTVVEKVEALKARGLTSPYLKSFVVARINPIRFRPKDAAPLSFDEVIERMTKAADKMNVGKVKIDDLAKSGGAPEEA